MQLKNFIFSPFQVNSFVLYDETKEAVIVDAACFFPAEEQQLVGFIEANQLNVAHIINTHNHLDHIFGLKFAADTFNVPIACHSADMFWIDKYPEVCASYGLGHRPAPPKPTIELNDNDIFTFGNTQLKVIHVPGHTAGAVAFYHKETNTLIAGDILFNGSIGRTDLPTGNYEQLIEGIKSKLLVLPDETVVYSGHGPNTTIGREKQFNPYLK